MVRSQSVPPLWLAALPSSPSTPVREPWLPPGPMPGPFWSPHSGLHLSAGPLDQGRGRSYTPPTRSILTFLQLLCSEPTGSVNRQSSPLPIGVPDGAIPLVFGSALETSKARRRVGTRGRQCESSLFAAWEMERGWSGRALLRMTNGFCCYRCVFLVNQS